LLLLLAAGVSLIAPETVRGVRTGSIAAAAASKIVITARLPPASEPRNNLACGETQSPHQTAYTVQALRNTRCFEEIAHGRKQA
jgi:hypothetical protein